MKLNQADFTRIETTVAHREPDRVPLVEILVEFPVQSRLLGRTVMAEDLPAQVEFWSRAGYDYVPLVMGMMRPGKVTEESPISRVIREQLRREGRGGDEKSWNLEYTSFIADRRRFEAFPWDLAARVDLGQFEAIAPLLPPGMKVIAISGKIFTLSWMLMGFENFCESLLADEGFAADVIRRVAEIQLSALDRLLAMEHVRAVWVVDDIAYNTGPMISPGALRDHIFPYYRRMAARCRSAGRMFFMHSDGDMRPVMADLISLGVQALHPIDPTAMDIAEVKKEFGRELCLFGNVDTELLRSGTTQQVEERVKELLRTVAPGGGFALSSGNSVPEWAKQENYDAMRAAAMKWGRYPISVG